MATESAGSPRPSQIWKTIASSGVSLECPPCGGAGSTGPGRGLNPMAELYDHPSGLDLGESFARLPIVRGTPPNPEPGVKCADCGDCGPHPWMFFLSGKYEEAGAIGHLCTACMRERFGNPED